MSILGAIFALLVAFLREIPLVVLAGGNAPGSSGLYSLAMFATPEFEVFAWGTISGGTVTLLAGFSLEGIAGLGLWGFLVIAAVLAVSGASPHATPQHARAQIATAAFLLIADAAIFFLLALFFSPSGLAGIRLGWYCVTIGGILLILATPEKVKDVE